MRATITMANQIDLDEAERIGKAATAGPWEVTDGVSDDRWGVVTELWPISPGIAACVLNKTDAEFMALARNNWQAMVDELRVARDRIEFLESELPCANCGKKSACDTSGKCMNCGFSYEKIIG